MELTNSSGLNEDTKRNKKSKRISNNENIIWESSKLYHNHELDEENKLEHQIISNQIKRKGIKSIHERASKLLHT